MTTTTGPTATGVADFPAIWLRDNCHCSECRDATSSQKLFQIGDLPEDLAVEGVERSGDTVTVTFAPDGHRSVFSADWLATQTCPGAEDDRSEAGKRLWRADDVAGHFPAASYARFLEDDRVRLQSLRYVQQLGFALLTGTPAEPGTVLEVAETLGFVRETNYGRLFDVRVEAAASNLAFTGLAIAAHTDNPYRDPVPTVQLLHCVANAVEGGESGLVDGFRAAATLREEEAVSFATLTSTPVPFAWGDATTWLCAEAPLIELDARHHIRGIRFNNRSMQPLRLRRQELVEFYAAYRSFAAVIARPELRVDFRLSPGDCLVLDNTRVLHARTAFSETASGSRHLQGCYADLDGLGSTIEMLRRRLETRS
jgi:gamma-butyrobetaine dioxygenase